MNLGEAVVYLLCAMSIAAAASGQTAGTALAVVSFNALVMQTNEAQRDFGALETKYAPRDAELQALNKEIEAARKRLNDTADKLSDEERTARTQALNAKEKQLEREAEDFRNDSQGEAQQAYQRVAQKVFAFVQEYAQQHGYAAVIDRGTDAAPVVWYAAENVDITDALIKAYNEKSGVPPPAQSAKPGAAPGASIKPPSLPQP